MNKRMQTAKGEATRLTLVRPLADRFESDPTPLAAAARGFLKVDSTSPTATCPVCHPPFVHELLA